MIDICCILTERPTLPLCFSMMQSKEYQNFMTDSLDNLNSQLTIAELESQALKFWPQSISMAQADASIIPKLIETQDKFISILTSADADPFAWKIALTASTLTANLFLKHLMVLSDVGGETLSSLKKELKR